MKKSEFTLLPVAALACALLAPNMNAGLADFQAIQSSNPNLVFQYGFEGSDDSTRLADGSGNGYTLQRLNGTDGGDVNAIQFLPGFDGVSQAYQPSFDTSDYRLGAGLNTISTSVPLSSSLTVEAVVQLDNFTNPTGGSGAYLLAGRPSGKDRGYFFRQLEVDRLGTTLGDTFGDVVDTLNPYTAGDWYYVALTADYNSGTGITTVNLYGANLSASEGTINLYATDNTTFTGDWTGSSQIGVGNFLNGTQEYMQGRLDNVALTDGVLGSSEFQARLDALYIVVPEPSTFALLGMAGLGLFLRRRRS